MREKRERKIGGTSDFDWVWCRKNHCDKGRCSGRWWRRTVEKGDIGKGERWRKQREAEMKRLGEESGWS